METWPECPLTSSSLFFVPRTVPTFWWGLSRHLVKLPTIYPHLTPLRYPQRLPIPIVVFICLLTYALFLLRTGWTALPWPPTPFGTSNKRHCCAGCHQSLSTDPYIICCAFYDRGCPYSNASWAYPCMSAYHTACFAAGPPFYTRREDGSGLAFPRIQTWPNFICEACTIGSMLDRELTGVSD
jgi:hypothetical protein